MSNIDWGDIPSLSQEYVVKPPKGKGKGQAKVKKMVVADPGLGVEAKFEPDEGENWTNVRLMFDLYVTNSGDPEPSPGDSPTHYAEFGIHHGDQVLDLPQIYSFVFPFSDTNWSTETGEGKKLYFRFRFSIEEDGSDWGSGDILEVPSASLKANKRFTFSPQGDKPPKTIHMDGYEITYSNVIKNVGTYAWHLDYHGYGHYTTIRDNDTHTEVYFFPYSEAGTNKSPITETAVCILPIPVFASDGEADSTTPEMDILRTNWITYNFDLELGDDHVGTTESAIQISLEDVPPS